MAKIDASKIKEMTNELVAYEIYEKENKMKRTKLKHALYVFMAFGVLALGTFSVNALTDNAISDAIKDVLKVKVNDTEYNAKCSAAKEGKIVCTLDENVASDKEVKFEIENDKVDEVTLDDDFAK